MQWHDVTRKIFGGPLGGPGKILEGQCPPPSSAPAFFIVLERKLAKVALFLMNAVVLSS